MPNQRQPYDDFEGLEMAPWDYPRRTRRTFWEWLRSLWTRPGS